MSKLSFLDWSLVAGVILYGACLAIYFEKRFRFPWSSFLMVAFFVSVLAAVLIGAYHVIRTAYAI